MVSLIVWLCVILCTIFIASLAEIRLLISLCKTFEFWLLQVVNVFSMVATCYNAFALNEAWANYTRMFEINLLNIEKKKSSMMVFFCFCFRSRAFRAAPK
jgi:hypothetical protein